MQEMLCDDGKTCIMPEWECDGHADCPDGTDENRCGMFSPFHHVLSSLYLVIRLGISLGGWASFHHTQGFQSGVQRTIPMAVGPRSK